MRDPEFMPPWYFLLLRRRRMVAAELWTFGAIVVVLAGWGLWGHHQISSAQSHLSNIRLQLTETGVDLQRLNEIEAVKKELEHQDQINRSLGLHVPASKMLSVLDQLMPPSMALDQCTMETADVPESLTDSQRTAGMKPHLYRKLQVSVDGLAPTYVELGTFMTRLSALPYVGEVALVRASDTVQGGHLMRTFEVNFVLNLGQEDSLNEVATAN